MTESSIAYKPETKRQRLDLLRGQLDLERASFISHWRELGNYILPRRPRFTLTDTNKGDRRSQNIIDSTATEAADTLQAGMMSGITSPARPWFRLTTPDPKLAELGPVKQWLENVTQEMNTVFLQSNLYKVLPEIYGDLGVFGTSAMSVEEDFEDVIRCYPFPVGSYMIANDHRLKVSVFFREFRMTVRQIVDKFCERDPKTKKPDYKNVSLHVRQMHEKGYFEHWVDVCHVIQPNEDYDPDKIPGKFKKFSSCYYEKGTSQDSPSTSYIQPNSVDGDKYLRESGFDLFPILVPRWSVTGEDVYSNSCPGMKALGDIKQLQIAEKKLLKAIDKMVDPPMTGPAVLDTIPSSILPGGTTFLDTAQGQDGFRPAHLVDPKVLDLEKKQEQVRRRIDRVFFVDLFLKFINDDRPQRATKFEILKTDQEKMNVLGSVLENLNGDLLSPLIEIAFDYMVRQGRIPEPPEELQEGLNLKVEYISIMAQAQKAIGVTGIEQAAAFITDIAQKTQDPSVLDKWDIDQTIDIYGEMNSLPAGIIRPDEEVTEIRENRAKEQKAQQMAEQLAMAAKGAKDLAGADMEKDSVLKRLVQPAA